MTPYARLSPNAGVTHYDPGEDFIRVKFAKTTVYTYTHASAGEPAIAEMKRLAANGKGLSTYIAQHKPRYASKTG